MEKGLAYMRESMPRRAKRPGSRALASHGENIRKLLDSARHEGLEAYHEAGKLLLEAAQEAGFSRRIIIWEIHGLTGRSVNTLISCRDFAEYWTAKEAKAADEKGMSWRAICTILPLYRHAQRHEEKGRAREARRLRTAAASFVGRWRADQARDDTGKWYSAVDAWKAEHQQLLGNPRRLRKLRAARQKMETARGIVEKALRDAMPLLARGTRSVAAQHGRLVAGAIGRLIEAL